MNLDIEALNDIVNNVVAIGCILLVASIVVPLIGGATAGPATVGNQSVVVGVQGVGDNGQALTVGPYSNVGGVRDSGWKRSDASSYHDVTQLNSTHILAAYAAEGNLGPRTGFRIIDTESNEIVRDWSYSVETLPNSEVHDAEPVPDGVLVAGMEYERIFIVNDSGAVKWQWNASQHYDAPADPTAEDWLHINDVDRISDGRYLVSVRNKDQRLIVERGQGVVDVINEDSDHSVIHSQHNPQWLGDGRVLVADSENNRVVELAEKNGTWEPVWAVNGAGGQRFFWPRDADRLSNGNTLITDSRNHRVVLVDGDGNLIEEWSTPQLPYDAELLGENEQVGGPYQTGGDRLQTPSPMVESTQLLLAGLHHSIGLPRTVSWWHVPAVVSLLLVKVLMWGVIGSNRLLRQVRERAGKASAQ